MAKARITKQQIDELLRFLPVLGNPGPETAAEWRGPDHPPEPGVTYMQFPVYPPVVREFFQIVGREPWIDYMYDSGKALAMLRDDAAIASASMKQIRNMLTFCVRGERFCDGHWESAVQNGWIGAILRRLSVLRAKAPNEQPGKSEAPQPTDEW